MCTRYPVINRVSELKVHIELTRFVQPEKIEIDANERAVNEKSPYCFFVCTTFDSFLNDLYDKWEQLLEELDIAHQMYLYAMGDTKITVDVKCAFLIELSETLAEVLKAYTNSFQKLKPGNGTSLKACVKALIEEYGKDIFEREMEANEKEFLSTVINSRVRIMHIKRNQKIKYFDGNESVLYILKLSLLYRRILLETLGVEKQVYVDKLRKCVSRLNRWNDTLDKFLLRL